MPQRLDAPARLSPAPPGTFIALMLTRRCNMACGHCSVESGPHVRTEPEETELIDAVRQAAAAGVSGIQLTGGEPMLRDRVVLRLLRECRRAGLGTALTTNGFWGRTLPRARRHLRALRRAGLGTLTVSYDRYHAAFQGPDPIRNILRAADERGVPVNVSIVRGADDRELADLVTQLGEAASARLRFYDLEPVGRARGLSPDFLRGEVEGFCGACAFPAVTDDGRVTACNGPSYFADSRSPLVVGSLRETPLASLLERHRSDPILDTIRTFGPSGLRDELGRTPGFEAFPFRKRYLGICDLCHHITSSPDAVAALRARLVRPELAAARLAAWQVIDTSRRAAGVLTVQHVNGVGGCRVFLRAAWETDRRWPAESENVLGRADVDWRHWASYLAGSGLARPLLSALDDPALTRWAPRFFVESLRTRAIRDGLWELVQREAIRQVASALRELGGRGVLLKGSALLHGVDGAARVTPRATGDVDVYVEPRLAPTLRARLLALGFTGAPRADRTAPHHLAPVAFHGVPVEIHTRIMASFWGLPERDILARARPLEGTDPLSALDAEGLLLHAGMHASQHFFSHGLKTAWDLLWILGTHPGIDWDRLARWVRASRVPRGFWVPVRVLAEELGIPLPAGLLRQAPTDARQQRLELIARRRLFRATEVATELNAISKSALILLLHESRRGRLRYLAAEVAWRGARRSSWDGPLRRAGRGASLRQAWLHWSQYRRALGRAR